MKNILGKHSEEWWEEFWSNPDFSFGPPRQELVEIALEHCRAKRNGVATLVDVGSGDGRYGIPFALAGFDSTTFELTTNGVARIRENARLANASVNIEQGNFIIIAKEPRAYDVVFSSGLLEEIDNKQDQATVIGGLQNWTAEGGLLILKFCLEIKDRGIRVEDGFAIKFFNEDEWEILHHVAEASMRDSNATIDFENKLRTETIIAIKKIKTPVES